MYFPTVLEDNNTLSNITTWLGYNHNYKTSNGQFYDMENMSSDYYPVLTPRTVRPTLADGENILGILYSDGNLYYLDGTTLHLSATSELDLSDYLDGETEQQMLRFGAYILMYPSKVYVNIYDDTDIGCMDSEFKAEPGLTIKYTMCKADGSDFGNVTVSDTAPTNPTNGSYWLCTALGSQGLNVWYDSLNMWQAVATTYIRVEVPGATLTDYFSEGDTVKMNTSLDDVNEGSTIQAIDDEYIVILGVFTDAVQHTDTTSTSWTLKIERKLPDMNYICVDKNRVWGCFYGEVDGKQVNEIYASKLGDFKNFYTYSGISTDSYAVTVGTPGEWTGCISYNGYPAFFKEDAIYRIYGDYPSEYQTIQTNCRGVQKGSHKSLCVVGDYLFYKSPSDVVVYDGSSPASVSNDLGKEVRYYAGIGGGCLDKYYIQLENQAGTKYFFNYNMTNGIWEKEDALDFIQFSSSEDGRMFACTDEKIIGLGSTDNYLYLDPLVDEEWTAWYCESGELGMEYADFKYVSRLTVRAWIPHKSEVTMSISYDGRPFEDVATLRGNSDIASQSYPISPYRCDHFRIRFEGHGDCRIYGLAIKYEAGSEEENAYY